MKRITGTASKCRAAGFSSQPCRWKHHGTSIKAKEDIEAKVKASFGNDEYGRELKLDAPNKKITTAGGDLPISPIFDPDWMYAKRRGKERKPKVLHGDTQDQGRFRRKLLKNPFGKPRCKLRSRPCLLTEQRMPWRVLYEDAT
jgi:hypothetical protein